MATAKKRGGADKFASFSIETQLDAANFHGYSDAELLPALDAAKAGNAAPLGALFVQRLEAKGMHVEQMYAIIHDGDTYSADDALDAARRGTPVDEGGIKPPHIHAMQHANARKHGLTLAAAADAVGVAPNMVQKPLTSGPKQWQNMLGYMCHSNAPRKHQYAPERVATIRGGDFITAWWEPCHEKWRSNAEVREVTADVAEGFSQLMDAIHREEVLTADDIEANPLYRTAYTHVTKSQRAQIDDALKATVDMRIRRQNRMLQAQEYEKSIMWIKAPEGRGKTKMAVTIAKTLAMLLGWKWTMLAEDNPIDEWVGQEIVICDDLNEDAMKPKGFLKALDPHNAAPMGARYHNKPAFAPRLIIVTNTKSPAEFWASVLEEHGKDAIKEPFGQFIRRVATNAEIVGDGFDDPYNVVLYLAKYDRKNEHLVYKPPTAMSWRDQKPPAYSHHYYAQQCDGNALPVRTNPTIAAAVMAGIALDKSMTPEESTRSGMPLGELLDTLIPIANAEYSKAVADGALPALPTANDAPYVVDVEAARAQGKLNKFDADMLARIGKGEPSVRDGLYGANKYETQINYLRSVHPQKFKQTKELEA